MASWPADPGRHPDSAADTSSPLIIRSNVPPRCKRARDQLHRVAVRQADTGWRVDFLCEDMTGVVGGVDEWLQVMRIDPSTPTLARTRTARK